ncbi:MAG: FHA domain-containing protein [Prevotellaceae bacterium]|jgi:hypothetical protein|nr:FHA domain-containing protein [Prevotellaceae bacterium]
MNNGFKKCSNGHYYQGATCPYCPQASTGSNATQTMETNSGGNASNAPTVGDRTQLMGGLGTNNVFTVPDNASNVPAGPGNRGNNRLQGGTVFGDDVEVETPTGNVIVEQQYRSTRKLVGWLVTYSFDKIGVDFKLYEGRNIIGRDVDCNITLNNDQMISGKHAILLFRSDKYSITDQQSSHGTFVNDEDIALEPHYIKDGDVIRMGHTVFKFRSSLF